MYGRFKLLNSKRRVDERLLEGGWIRGSLQASCLWRVYYINIVQYSAPILYRKKGNAKIDVDVVI